MIGKVSPAVGIVAVTVSAVLAASGCARNAIESRGQFGPAASDALVAAIEAGDEAAVRRLLDEGVDPNRCTTDFNKKLPLVQAVIKEKLPIATALLDAKAHVNGREGTIGSTALMLAAASDLLEFAKLLVSRGADVNLANIRDMTPIAYATERASPEMVAFLVDKGAALNVRGARKRPLIVSAALNPNLAVLRYLLDRGVSVADADGTGYTALMAAAGTNRPEAVRLLLAHGADAKRLDEDGWSALYRAADRRALEVARQLLSAGAPVDQATKAGNTALMRAAFLDDTQMLDLLLAQGAKVDSANVKGETALAIAAEGHHWDAARLLLAHGASIALLPAATEKLARDHLPADVFGRNDGHNAAKAEGSAPATLEGKGDSSLKPMCDRLMRQSREYLHGSFEILKKHSGDSDYRRISGEMLQYAGFGSSLAGVLRIAYTIKGKPSKTKDVAKKEQVDALLNEVVPLILDAAENYLGERPDYRVVAALSAVAAAALMSAQLQVNGCQRGASYAGIALRLSEDLVASVKGKYQSGGRLEVSDSALAEIDAFATKASSLCRGKKTKQVDK
jgi:ankyrin repeat protein